MHLPSLSQVLLVATGYVAVASVVCNVLPKDSVFDAYPRAKRAYGTVVVFVAVSAFNIRQYLPAANLKIPFLGFGQYERDHPELFGQVRVEHKVTDTITGAVGSTPAAAAAAVEAAKPKE